MQPAQLSLLPDQGPPPPANIINELPGPDVAAAAAMLARLIAQAASPRPGDGPRTAMSKVSIGTGHGDE